MQAQQNIARGKPQGKPPAPKNNSPKKRDKKDPNRVRMFNFSGRADVPMLVITLVLLAAVTGADALDVFYETVSATATVGLTRGLTPRLNVWGKLIIIAAMYLGRVGPISLVVVSVCMAFA